MRWHLLVAVAAGLASAATAVSADLTLYVSPSGNDRWSGSRAARLPGSAEGPFATIARARDEIRARRTAGEEPGRVTVWLRGGTYHIAQPLRFGPEDSGRPGAPIRYAAWRGEKPVVSGGRVIRGWRPIGGGVWRTEVPEAKGRKWVFRQLWLDDRRLTLARSPNVGFWTTAGKAGPITDPATGARTDRSQTAFRYAPGTVRPWRNLADANVVLYQIWETSLLPLKSVDPAKRTVTFAGPAKWPMQWYGRQRYIIENHEGALDAPGEWQLDRDAGTLSLIPPKGIDPRKATITAPMATSLLEIQGDPAAGRLVSNVWFSGIAFRHAEWSLPAEGHGDWQAAVSVPGAVTATGAADCRFTGCEVAHVGQYGLELGAGCSRNRVEACHFTDLGAGGVKVGRPEPATGPTASGGNVVDNCFIHDGGIVHAGAIGVWVGQSSDNTISHNEICDMNYTGISVGWSWGYDPTTCHRNRIEFNHLHHLGRRVMSDMAAIYTLGISTGTVIRNNLIHEIWGHETSGAGGIYPDEGTTGALIEDNVVYGTIFGGLSIHYGRDITVRNNVFAFSRDRQVSRGRADKGTTFAFERNIVLYERGELMGGSGAITASGSNLYWRTGGKPVLFPGDVPLATWQAAGNEKGSLVADPGFVDARRFDFRLKPGSPAQKLGFRPIDTSRCGLTGDPAWRKLPRLIRREPFAYPTRPEGGGYLPNETFEDEPEGVAAENAVTYGEAGSGNIRVTAETAASGRQSLRFADAAGMDFTFNPHLWFVPNLLRGRAKLTFDLRVDARALPAVEWRDASSPYRVGPSLNVDAEGALNVGGRKVAILPHGQWLHFEVSCGLGSRADGKWALRVTGRGVDLALEGLACDPKFNALQWLGFIANANEAAIFYLDNVKLTAQP
jgi:hypothetical protein